MSDGRVVFAATYGRVFKVDPVGVMQSDYYDWALRQACLQVVAEQKKKENEASKARR